MQSDWRKQPRSAVVSCGFGYCIQPCATYSRGCTRGCRERHRDRGGYYQIEGCGLQCISDWREFDESSGSRRSIERIAEERSDSSSDFCLIDNYQLMTWVKICGITNLEDALAAADAGADALGFVFHEKSPRYVDPGTAAAIAQQVTEKIEKVGVFVDPPQNGLAEIANGVGLTMLQCRVGSKPGAESKAAFQQPVRMLFQLSVGRLLAD